MANSTYLTPTETARQAPGLPFLLALRREFSGAGGTLILIGVFLMALLPFVTSAALMYPDEPQYLDAGVIMCQTNDWLMPACPNNRAPEDLKPILTYWIVALSFKLFGTSLAAARLPYLLAGAVVVWLTHRLALMLTASDVSQRGSRVTATLACALLLTNPVFWLSAMRCIPDIWLCLFLLVSVHGFLGLLALERPTGRHAMMAYVGVSLAFLAKGVPALMFAGYVMLFIIASPWRRQWRRLVHVPSMLIAVVVASSWFGLVLLTHGPEYMRLLWADQVGTRTQGNLWVVASRFPVFLLAVILMYVPQYWPMWKMAERWRSILPAPGRQRLAYAFILPWGVLNVAAMCCTQDWYSRYVIPLLPLLAVVVAIALAKVDGRIVEYCYRRLLIITLLGLTVVAAAAIVFGASLGATGPDALCGALLIGGMALAAVLGFRGSWPRAVQAIAAAFMLATPMTFLVARSISRPDIEAQIGQRLKAGRYLADRHVAGFIGSKGAATRLRLALPARVTLMQWESLPADGATDLPDVVVLPASFAPLLAGGRYELFPAGSLFAGMQEEEIYRAIGAGALKDKIVERRVEYCIAVRK